MGGLCLAVPLVLSVEVLVPLFEALFQLLFRLDDLVACLAVPCLGGELSLGEPAPVHELDAGVRFFGLLERHCGHSFRVAVVDHHLLDLSKLRALLPEVLLVLQDQRGVTLKLLRFKHVLEDHGALVFATHAPQFLGPPVKQLFDFLLEFLLLLALLLLGLLGGVIGPLELEAGALHPHLLAPQPVPVQNAQGQVHRFHLDVAAQGIPLEVPFWCAVQLDLVIALLVLHDQPALGHDLHKLLLVHVTRQVAHIHPRVMGVVDLKPSRITWLRFGILLLARLLCIGLLVLRNGGHLARSFCILHFSRTVVGVVGCQEVLCELGKPGFFLDVPFVDGAVVWVHVSVWVRAGLLFFLLRFELQLLLELVAHSLRREQHARLLRPVCVKMSKVFSKEQNN
uniref:Uncharacterized protein n=1 Tax=Ixodes ricinus TaxID=34613 RepID=A0A6B0VBI4_IXORI